MSATAIGGYDDRFDASRRHRLPSRLLRLASDERLVELLRERGSEAAFEALYARHHRGVLSFCRHMVGSVEEAEDAVQHTFLAAFRDIVGSRKQIQVRPWLYAIARNRCITVLRARREQAGAAVEPSTELLSVEVERRHELRALLGDLAGLPDDQRAALVLAELGDMSHDEIGQALGCPREKVKALVFQARSSLIASREARDASCDEVREQLANLRGGALRRNLLRRHLHECAGCRDFRAKVAAQRRDLALILPVAPSLGLQAAVLGAAGGAATSSVVAKTAIVLVVAGGGVAAVEEARHHEGERQGRSAAAAEPVPAADPFARVAGASVVSAAPFAPFGPRADGVATSDSGVRPDDRGLVLGRSDDRGRDGRALGHRDDGEPARGRNDRGNGSSADRGPASGDGRSVGGSGQSAPASNGVRAVDPPTDRRRPGVGNAGRGAENRDAASGRSESRDVASGRVGDRGGSLDRAAAPQPAAPKPAASTPAKNVVEVKAPPQAQAPPPETAPKILPAQAAAGLETAAEKAPQAGE